MRWLATIFVVFVLLAYGVHALWQRAEPTYLIRYRLSLHVAVGDEIRTGSSVVETAWTEISEPVAGIWYTIAYRGEAVFVDLGAPGTLFAVSIRIEPPSGLRLFIRHWCWS